MTKRDFELIAYVFKEEMAWYTDQNQMIIEELAKNLANRLEETNSRFDKDGFLKACGVYG